jgi:hypothetical protein
MIRQQVIDEATNASAQKPVKDRQCLTTPISKLTAIDHLQPSYYNVLLQNDMFKLSVRKLIDQLLLYYIN